LVAGTQQPPAKSHGHWNFFVNLTLSSFFHYSSAIAPVPFGILIPQ
jgi:hypothetical protein